VILRERFTPCGLEFHLNDITTDLQIPVLFALLIDKQNDGLAVAAGASANLNPEAAALKALIEAAQVRQWLKLIRQQDRNDRYREDFSDVVSFEDHVRLYGSLSSIPYVHFLTQSPELKDISAIPTLGALNPVQDLKRCVKALASKGFDVLVVDLTQPDVQELGLHVVKVLVPGMIDINADHNYPLLGGDRLRNVPRTLGGIDHDVRETEFNVIPHPFP